MTAEDYLKSVGKKCFITYYELFQDFNIDRKTLIKELKKEKLSSSSCDTKATDGRQIFIKNLEIEALISILHSKKLNNEILTKARKKLNEISSQSDQNIPNGITKEMILDSAKIYDEGKELHYFTNSRDFDVIINDKLYPPKAIIEIASKFITRVLHPSEFSAGHDKKCFKTLIDLGFNIIRKESKENDIFNDNEIDEVYKEGKSISVIVNKYERDPSARRKCIEHFGIKCQICDFDFLKIYGDIGKDFIHVHHIKPISEIGEEYEVNPINDLIPVCPNCHAMLHRRKPAYSINEIKNTIKE